VTTPRELKPCGTTAAYQRHLRHREVPCGPCVEARRRRHLDYERRRGRKPRYPEEEAA